MFNSYQNLNFDESAALGILRHLDQGELARLLEDDTKLQDLVADLQQVKNIAVEKETLITSNKSLADYNMSREPKLTAGKGQLAEVYEQAVVIQKQFEENKQKLDFICAKQSLDTTLALLQTETAKAEEEAEELAESFMSGDIEVESFLGQYIDLRKLGHLRKVKAEKMAELLRNRASQARSNSLGQASGSGYAPHSGANSWGGPASYPAGGYGMPDPAAYLHR